MAVACCYRSADFEATISRTLSQREDFADPHIIARSTTTYAPKTLKNFQTRLS
jgi:hypothetical protein